MIKIKTKQSSSGFWRSLTSRACVVSDHIKIDQFLFSRKKNHLLQKSFYLKTNQPSFPPLPLPISFTCDYKAWTVAVVRPSSGNCMRGSRRDRRHCVGGLLRYRFTCECVNKHWTGIILPVNRSLKKQKKSVTRITFDRNVTIFGDF